MGNEEMKVGDIIEVHEIVALGPDRWRPATVIAVRFDTFAAQLNSGYFGKEGEDRMWIQRRTKGAQWK